MQHTFFFRQTIAYSTKIDISCFQPEINFGILLKWKEKIAPSQIRKRRYDPENTKSIERCESTYWHAFESMFSWARNFCLARKISTKRGWRKAREEKVENNVLTEEQNKKLVSLMLFTLTSIVLVLSRTFLTISI